MDLCVQSGSSLIGRSFEGVAIFVSYYQPVS